MIARIEDGLQLTLRHHATNLLQVAKAIGFLLSQTALVAFVFAAWRLGSDLNWTGEFFVSSGLLSHWQVWLAIAIMARIGVTYLNRLDQVGAAQTAR
jgi:hypothetical protein